LIVESKPEESFVAKLSFQNAITATGGREMTGDEKRKNGTENGSDLNIRHSLWEKLKL
jgi:hypothetical protein